MTTVDSESASAPKAAVPDPIVQAAHAALGKKATDPVVLDLRPVQGFTDYFLICSGQNERQVKAIAEAIEATLKESGIRPALVEGHSHADWILLDYFDFIVHVFRPDTRAYYQLERLWGSATRLDLPPEPAGRPSATSPL